jgi:CBS domain-containing protein
MRVADMMRSDVRTIGPEAPVQEVVQAMADHHVSGLPVVGTDRLIQGVVSASDVLQAAAEREDERARTELFEHTTARDLMTAKPLTIAPEADVREAAEQMLNAGVKRLFVEDDGRLVGVVSQTDIAYAVGTGKL